MELKMCIQNKYYYVPQKREKEGETSFMNYLYKSVKNLNNPERTIKRCMSILYHDGYFLEAVYSNLVEYDGFSEDGCYWYYSDMNSPFESDRFEGVKFAVGFDDPDYTVYVSEQVCFNYTKEACLRFLEIHPEHTEFVMNILNNWKPSTKNNQ